MNLRDTTSTGSIQPPASKALENFCHIASLLHGEIFVNLVAYVDESGTHDSTGQQPSSSAAIMLGLIDHKDNWLKFVAEWQATLNRNSVDVFHFSEWRTASKVARGTIEPPSKYKSGPYNGWPLEKVDKFWLELAALAGGREITTSGVSVPVREFHASCNFWKDVYVPAKGDHKRYLAETFFQNLCPDVQFSRPKWTGDVSIFYEAADKGWVATISSSFLKAKEKEGRLAEIVFADKKRHIALQAADLVAARFRQIFARIYEVGEYEFAMETIKRGSILPIDRCIFDSMFREFESLGLGPNPFKFGQSPSTRVMD
jgi:hypothetical protein